MKLTEIQAKLKERVAKGLNFGIEAVEEVIDPASDLYNEFVLLKSQYNDLMYVSTINTLPYEQIEIGLNRLRSNVLGLIDKMDAPGLKKAEVESDMKIQALPTRRENFFKLLDIHFRNLDAIVFTERSGDIETRYFGRHAIFYYYRMHVRPYHNRANKDSAEGLAEVQQYFADYFSNEIGGFEVYFKNIQHLLAYTFESEVEQQFFLNTVRSLFSRYELGMLFYYALSEINPAFTKLVVQAKLIDPELHEILISDSHLQSFNSKLAKA